MAATTAFATSTPETRSAAPAQSTQRLMSVDALRGFDMFWIIGAESLFAALNQLSKSRPTQFLANQLEHVEWEGMHFYDLIFPLFVFIMGVSVVFSLSRIIEREGRPAAMKRVVRRGVLLFALGLFYYGGLSTPVENMRVMGVLNRIALCYLFGGLIFCCFKPRGMAGICVGLLLGYWALLALVPFPDVRPKPGGDTVITKDHFTTIAQLNMDSTNLLRGSYIQGVNLANYLDQKYLPGRKHDGTYDPEGLLSTLPAIATCLLGIFAGLLLKSCDFCETRKVVYLISFGAGGVLLGFLWGTQFPVIKKIWTSSYVLVAGGYSAILLGVFYWIVDVLKYQKWCQPFVWIGMNSITLYLTANLLTGGFDKLATRFAGGDVKAFFDIRVAQGAGDLVIAIVGLLLAFWLAHFLYRNKIFLRV
jgi:predicted acyltransferase